MRRFLCATDSISAFGRRPPSGDRKVGCPGRPRVPREELPVTQPNLDPSNILQVGMGFWPSKTLLSAVELELFTELGEEAMTGEAIGERLGLHARGIYDFLDT